MRPPGRPLGDFSRALLSAAAQGPGTMRELATRARVGYDVARHKTKTLARTGHLVALMDERPRVYALPDEAQSMPLVLPRSFWDLGDDESVAA